MTRTADDLIEQQRRMSPRGRTALEILRDAWAQAAQAAMLGDAESVGVALELKERLDQCERSSVL